MSKFTVPTLRWSAIERSGRHEASLSGRINRDVPPGSCRQSERYGLQNKTKFVVVEVFSSRARSVSWSIRDSITWQKTKERLPNWAFCLLGLVERAAVSRVNTDFSPGNWNVSR